MSTELERALVVLCHPRTGSFNHAVAARAAAALRDRVGVVDACDLYAEGFDPLVTPAELATTLRRAAAPLDAQVLTQQELLAACESLVVVHPNWWASRWR